ncbi:MAG TPA: IclR family transcriptional regulator [Burkholderiaceae bacterium]|nr:IclR family transcriptional regulator [Burkholderiaceae bacterium]
MPPARRPPKPVSKAKPVAAPRGQRGIQSVEVGGQLLRALAHHGRPMALKDLAREAGMTPAKAHPYLVSFGKLGLIEQTNASGHYGLGALAMQLGLISLQQFDPVRLATPRLAELARTLQHTVAIAVWGNRGATIVRIEEAPSAVHVNMRHGTVMSLRGTASGRLFAAYLPPTRVREALALEEGGTAIDRALAAELECIRTERISRAVDAAVPGVSALAAPVFGAQGQIVLSLTAIGPSPMFDTAANGALARELRRVADELSAQLGAGSAVP